MRSLFILFCVALFLSACDALNSGSSSSSGSGSALDLNLFPIDKDKELGNQVAGEIEKDAKTYPLLDEVKYAKAYGHIRRITNKLLNSGKLEHRNDFDWQVKLIQDDKTLNAFCTPGGKIYVYTGLIKYLNTEDDLAGVMGHEIAHADKRHSTEAMTRDLGITTLLNIVAGQNQSMLIGLAKNLIDLKYSRTHETEADAYSVQYLSGTNYKCNGAASFFEKIQASGGSQGPEFLSTHPDPGNRVQNINAQAKTKGCNTTAPASDAQYADFKASLP
ncbi:MAG: Peptidase family [Cytophagaceae bacterium]|jgi:predicted Zn-dependent protease|nr:Peptidase family [Cytophagaceae bacterium]